MAVYTIHIPKEAGDERPALERIVFLRDGFSWAAFLFGPLWLAWRRAWLAAAAWALFVALLAGVGHSIGLSRTAISILEFAAGVLLGFEGPRLVAWSLTRRGYAESGVMVAESADEAEEIFFGSRRPDAAAGVPAGGLIEEPRP